MIFCKIENFAFVSLSFAFCKVGNIPGFIAPTVVGFLLDDYGNRFQWQVLSFAPHLSLVLSWDLC